MEDNNSEQIISSESKQQPSLTNFLTDNSILLAAFSIMSIAGIYYFELGYCSTF